MKKHTKSLIAAAFIIGLGIIALATSWRFAAGFLMATGTFTALTVAAGYLLAERHLERLEKLERDNEVYN